MISSSAGPGPMWIFAIYLVPRVDVLVLFPSWFVLFFCLLGSITCFPVILDLNPFVFLYFIVGFLLVFLCLSCAVFWCSLCHFSLTLSVTFLSVFSSVCHRHLSPIGPGVSIFHLSLLYVFSLCFTISSALYWFHAIRFVFLCLCVFPVIF